MSVRPKVLSGTVVLREGRVVYASAGAAEVVGRETRDLMGRAFLEFAAPEERARLADRYARRLRGEPVPDLYEVSILLPDGARRTVEAQVSLEGRGETVVQVRDLSDQAERRARLPALAELGVAIQREGSAEAIHERVREGLFGLGLSSLLVTPEAGGVRVVWARLPGAALAALEARLGPAAGYLGRLTPFAQAAWAEGSAFADDFVDESAAFLPPEESAAARAVSAAEALVRGLAVRLDERSGPSAILVAAGGWIGPGDVPAFRLFAAQVAAALDTQRLVGDLRRRVGELTLLNDVAVDTAALDPATLLDRALRRMCATFGADVGLAFLPVGDGLERQAALGLSAPSLALTARLDAGEGPAGLAMTRLAPVRTITEVEAGPRCWEARRAEGIEALVAVPLLAASRAVGALCLGRRAPRPFEPGDVMLLEALGAQLGVAVDAARQHADTQRRARDLEAISSLALRFFAGPPGDATRILEEACAEILQALKVRQAIVMLLDDEGQHLTAAAADGEEVPPAVRVMPLERSGLAREALERGVPVASEDASRDPRSGVFGVAGVPARAVLAIPIASRSRRRGLIFAVDLPGRRFAPADLSLATALGGELAMALESAELHAEARRRLGELSAIIDVARAVSSSLDLDRVLEMGAEHLKETVGGEGCTVLLADHRAGVLRRAAWCGAPIEAEAVPLDAPSLARDALAGRAPSTGRIAGRGAVLAVPLLVRDQPLGVALVSAPGEGRRFAEAELARAVAIASQLGVAVDNARLYSETRRRAEELSLLQDVGRTLVETLELEQVLTAGVGNLARMVDSPEAYLLLLDEAAGDLVIQAVSGPNQAQLGVRMPYDPGGNTSSRCMERREPIPIDDALHDPAVDPRLRALTGMRAGLALPLLVRDKAIGACMIVERGGPRHYTAGEVQRATAVSNQLAVAVDNARAHARALAALGDLQQAQEKLLHRERLAALGELSAVVAHEVRNPLGVIFNSLGTLRRLLHPEGDAATLLDIVGEEADRLNRIVGDLLDFARPAPPQLRPERLDRLVEEAVAAALAQRPTAVTVVRELAPGLPPVLLDGRQIRQALLNVAANAVQAMPRGGRLTVRARLEGPLAIVEVEDCGGGIPVDVVGRIFEPFFTTKATGSGLGLAVVKRIVDAHGGEVLVGQAEGGGARFTLRFQAPPATPVESGGRIG